MPVSSSGITGYAFPEWRFPSYRNRRFPWPDRRCKTVRNTQLNYSYTLSWSQYLNLWICPSNTMENIGRPNGLSRKATIKPSIPWTVLPLQRIYTAPKATKTAIKFRTTAETLTSWTASQVNMARTSGGWQLRIASSDYQMQWRKYEIFSIVIQIILINHFFNV